MALRDGKRNITSDVASKPQQKSPPLFFPHLWGALLVPAGNYHSPLFNTPLFSILPLRFARPAPKLVGVNGKNFHFLFSNPKRFAMRSACQSDHCPQKYSHWKQCLFDETNCWFYSLWNHVTSETHVTLKKHSGKNPFQQLWCFLVSAFWNENFHFFFTLKTSADYKEHVLKAEGKTPKHKPLFLPLNHDFIHEKHHFWQQRLNKDLWLLSYPTKKSAELLSRPLENLFNPCVPRVSVKSSSPHQLPKTQQRIWPAAFPLHGPTDQNQLKSTTWSRGAHWTQSVQEESPDALLEASSALGLAFSICLPGWLTAEALGNALLHPQTKKTKTGWLFCLFLS